MKSESNIKPPTIEIERHGESAEVIFRENVIEDVREQEDGTEIVYTYDEYCLNVPYRENLLETVEVSKAQWLEKAKASEYEMLAIAVRAKRDKLLAESDKEMSLDRLSLETSSATKFIASLVSIFNGAWAKYRQELRDLPQQHGFPYNVEFPKKPEEK